ncbi:MAG: B12-binding domain-containing radical SAM protein [Proteobacteria bacterium]|nr:B12-binding domain-containing radical SAM protein [Pseudomonadota bacterium]
MNKYRIALVEAVSDLTHVYSRTCLPRVGLATIASVLTKNGYTCDLWIKPMSESEKMNLVNYDLVGIGSLSSTIREAYLLGDFLRKKNIKVVMGGPHVSFMPEEALDHCDYVIKGEGDTSFLELVKLLEKGETPEAIGGISYKTHDNTFQHNAVQGLVNFSEVPSPDFTLSPQIDKNNIPPIVITSRGCPHDCSFCSVTPLFGRKYRFKSHAQVIEELRPVQHKSVCFGDDNFCANPKQTKSLLREMIKQKAVPLRWSGQMCVSAASDHELLELMKETRCRIVYVGVESVDPATLKKYGKAHTVDAVKQCVDNLHKYNIGIHGMFVVDSKDSPDAAKNIVDYAIKTDIDTIQVFSITPFPGTRAYTENKDRLLHSQWTQYDGMHVVVNPEKCSAYDMQMAIVDQMNRFYSMKRVLTSYRKNRGWRVKYRIGGHILMKKWVKENADYIESLKAYS